jgi:hypothetical protein
MQCIQSAAKLAGMVDKNVEQVYLTQPFNRRTITEAFRISLKQSKYNKLADRICDAMLKAIELDKEKVLHG